MQSFSDLVKRSRINEEGEKIPIAEVMGKEITVIGYDMRPSNMHKKDYLCLKFELNGKKHVLFTDSEILKKQCERFHNEMPFTATIIKKDRYFKFT